MGFWKSFFGGEEENPEEEKKNSEAKTFDLMKYDGVKAMRMGQFDYAEKCFCEALKIQEDLEVRDYLSQTLVRLNRLDEALEQLISITHAEPENVALLLQAAHVAYMQEDYDQMKSFCEQALAVDGENAMANYMLAQAVLGQNDLINGIARLTRAISLNEQLADARLLRAKTLLKMGDVKGAEEDTNWLLEHTNDEEDVLLMAARVAHANGQDDEAIDIYNKVIDLNPFQMDAYRERGQIKFERGDKRGAQEDMQKLLELNPNELADVSGDYSAEGVEQAMKRVYSAINPFGL
ncbi:lipopolysaccharide assembly protein LapB [Prevotella sp. E2-28]|uniref:tetratricopeptide repeat protein n=1 Tax=Prevotella sp. E2-28 TaxID=2913620 RepID=UPI001EDBE065|nr:tetratricopeptide repeat protein [Prevotella sp. E2-28]UKK52876.1 tetratricopeptide repeat protein [Prevotella sp. E2-28]